jgi:hypothetical protein
MPEELDETLSDKLTAIMTVLAKNTASLLNPTIGPLIYTFASIRVHGSTRQHRQVIYLVLK